MWVTVIGNIMGTGPSESDQTDTEESYGLTPLVQNIQE